MPRRKPARRFLTASLHPYNTRDNIKPPNSVRSVSTAMTQQPHSAVASYIQGFSITLEERGLDPQAIFRKAGITVQASSDPMKRITNEEISRLFDVAIEATGDPALGVAVGSHMVPANLHALGFALLASSTLRDFYDRIARYYRIASDNADFVHYEEGGASVLEAANPVDNVSPSSAEAWVALMVRFMRSLYEKELNPLWVRFGHSLPPGTEQIYQDYFKCPVYFDCDEIARIAIDSSLMDIPLPGASPDLAQQNDQIVREYLEKRGKQDVINRVRLEIVSNLSSGTVSSQGVAMKLHMSPRTMQSKLSQKDTNFQEILDNTRRELAGAYMDQSHLAITEIAYLLGFTDASNFTRAFRRWHGVSPRDYRKQKAGNEGES
jgi:AraC-like DNA-binding protein